MFALQIAHAVGGAPRWQSWRSRFAGDTLTKVQRAYDVEHQSVRRIARTHHLSSRMVRRILFPWPS
jgi:hypothetical protein